MAGFRIGNIEIGVSADVSQALRGISQVSRELGSFQRIQARTFARTSSDPVLQQLKAQREINRAIIQQNQQSLINLKSQRQQIEFQALQLRNQRESLQATFLQRRAQDQLNASVLKGLLDQRRAAKDSLAAQIATARRQRNSDLNRQAEEINVLRRQLTTRVVNGQVVPADIRPQSPEGRLARAQIRDKVADLRIARNFSRDAGIQEEADLARAAAAERGVAGQLRNTTLASSFQAQQENAQVRGIRAQEAQLGLALQNNSAAAEGLRLRNAQVQTTNAGVEAQIRARREEIEANNLSRERLQIAASIRDTVIALGAGLATGALFRIIEGSTLLAARVENLKTVLNNVGQTAGYNTQQLGNFEDRVKSLGITTQAARSSLTLLAQNEQDLGQSTKLARIAQDAAAISATNSSEAFQRLVTAVERLDTRLLRSLGIVVNLRQVYSQYALETGKSAETLSAAEKQQLLLNEVLRRGARIAGTYEASMNDAFKQMTSFDRLVEELRREFGGNFLPVFEQFVSLHTALIGKDDNSGLRGVVRQFGPLIAGFSTLAVALGGAAVAVKSFSLISGALGLGIPTLAGSLALLLNPFTLIALAVAGASAAYVGYQASVRKARVAEEEHLETLRKTTQAHVEAAKATSTVRELGAYAERSAEQQGKLNASLDKIIEALPEYNKQLVEARGNLQEFLKIAEGATRSVRRSNEEVEQSFALRRKALEDEAASLLRAADPTAYVEGGKANFYRSSSEEQERIRRGVLPFLTANPGENLQTAGFVGSDAAQERIPVLVRHMAELNAEIEQFRAAVPAIRSQELNAIFDKQQEAAEATLKVTKDFEQSRLEAVKDTNASVIEDYTNVTKAINAQYLTVQQAAELRDLNIAAGAKRIGLNFDETIKDLEASYTKAVGTDAEGKARKALEDAQAKKETALREDREAAERDYKLAVKQIESRRVYERDALASIEQRLKFQAEEIALQEKSNRLAQLQSEDADDYLKVEQATLEIGRKRQAFEQFTAKALDELYRRRRLLSIQQGAPGLFGTNRSQIGSEIDSVVGQITQVGRIRALQLQALAAQEQEAKIALENTRKEAKREVENFLRDTADALFVRFNSNGGLSQIAVPFQNLTKRIAEARQAFRQTTDTFREQVAKAQNQEQLLGLRSLFGQQIKSDQRAGRAKLLELIKARDALSGNETLTDDEFFKQRDELDAQILEQRRFIAEQKKFEEEERARFQERLDARAQELVQQGISVDLEAIRTGYILQQLEAVKSMVELERQRDAFYGTPRFGATQGGRARDANGNVAAPSGVPTVVPDPRALPSRARPGAGTGTVEGSTSVTEAAFGSNNAGVTTGTSAPILPGATTRGDVEALQAFIRNGPAGAAQLVQALQIKENSTHEILEGIHEAFKDASNAVLRTKDDVDRVAKVVQRDIESFRNAARARGLTQ